MSKSLQEQLLALGVAKAGPTQTRSKVQSVNQQKQAQRRQGSKSRPRDDGLRKAATDTSELSLETAYRLRENHARQLAEQTRQRKREEERRRRQVNESIRVIVETSRLNEKAAELSRNFMYKGRIRKVNVTAEQLVALNEGLLGLVYLSGGYHILPAGQVEKVRTISEDHVPDLGGNDIDDDRYPVPDDLIW